MTDTPATCAPPAILIIENAVSIVCSDGNASASQVARDVVRELATAGYQVVHSRVAEPDEVEALRGLARLLWNCHFELGERLFVNRGLSEGTWPHARLTPLGKRALGMEG